MYIRGRCKSALPFQPTSTAQARHSTGKRQIWHRGKLCAKSVTHWHPTIAPSHRKWCSGFHSNWFGQRKELQRREMPKVLWGPLWLCHHPRFQTLRPKRQHPHRGTDLKARLIALITWYKHSNKIILASGTGEHRLKTAPPSPMLCYYRQLHPFHWLGKFWLRPTLTFFVFLEVSFIISLFQ